MSVIVAVHEGLHFCIDPAATTLLHLATHAYTYTHAHTHTHTLAAVFLRSEVREYQALWSDVQHTAALSSQRVTVT